MFLTTEPSFGPQLAIAEHPEEITLVKIYTQIRVIVRVSWRVDRQAGRAQQAPKKPRNRTNRAQTGCDADDLDF